ncbi:hypothetical protein [Pseudomonas oryzihabitans]|uniref:hypothetical protein n=1 Tax=Pseudomonas oryzihabitans TaxID=47885 RepID=UPI0021B5F0CD|nr:hypothetical protein [Pseudomonas oryzihabitans]
MLNASPLDSAALNVYSLGTTSGSGGGTGTTPGTGGGNTGTPPTTGGGTTTPPTTGGGTTTPTNPDTGYTPDPARLPDVMLGGLPILLDSGPPRQSIEPTSEGRTRTRLSGGALVQMTHFRKVTVSIAGSGFMGPGFAGLDYSRPLELRCTQHRAMTSTALTLTLDSTPRPDFAPWAVALVGRSWIPTPVAVQGRAATVTAVADAKLYRVEWMPVFTVFADHPSEALDPSGSGSWEWSFTCEEI